MVAPAELDDNIRVGRRVRPKPEPANEDEPAQLEGLGRSSTYRGSFTGGKAVLDGFTVGATIWGRVRKIGTGGEVGDWSDPAQFLVH